MKNKNIKFIIIAIAIAIVFAVGLTYAYFSADVSNSVNVNATAETKARDIFIASGDVELETEVTNAFMQSTNAGDSIEKSGNITISLTAGSDIATCNYDLAISNSGSVAYTKSPTAGDLFEYTVQGTDNSATPQTFAEINVDSAMASTKSATTAQDSTKQVSSGILGNYSIKDSYDEGTQASTTQTWTIKTKFYNLNKLQDAQEGKNYSYDIKVVNVNCKNSDSSSGTDDLVATPNYTGYYADIDNDGTVDGVIFADLLKSSNNFQDTVSGVWNEDEDSTYSYNTITSAKTYDISSSNYTGSFGSNPIISIKSGSSGTDRFYVMALDDIDSNVYYWNKSLETITSVSLEAESNTQVLIHDSDGQSIGERNTAILMGISALTSNSYNVWNHISTQVANGWFVPSRAEWSAFGDYTYSKAELTNGEYATMGLKIRYWTSSMRDNRRVWAAYFDEGYIGNEDADLTSKYIRLATTF